MTGRLLDLYGQATPAVRRRGRTWYPEAYRLCVALARETGHTPAQVAAVLAITSQNAQLAANVRWTELIVRGEREYGQFEGHQAPRVKAALASKRPGKFISGPKCIAFYRAIMGDTSALVIDRWAAAAVGHKTPHIGNPLRRQLDTAYREAAAFCGETVRAFQAITWIVVRESTPKSNGVIPRLADITS